MTNKTKLLLSTGLLAIITANGCLAAERCSRLDINRYLDQGYSLAEISMICSDNSGARQKPEEAPTESSDVDAGTRVFLQTAIDADKVDVTPDALIITEKDCFPYGEEGYGGIQPSACATRQVTILRKGMKVGEVVEERFLLRTGKLIVKGNITQRFTGTESLSKRDRNGLLKYYPEKLDQFDVPVKPRMKRKEVAKALEKLEN